MASPLTLWDGASGVTGTHANKGLVLPWERSGGDWTDANGAKHGLAAYFTQPKVAARATPITFRCDITALIKRSGQVFVRCSGVSYFATKLHTNTDYRPALLIDGTVVSPIASCSLPAKGTSPVMGVIINPTTGAIDNTRVPIGSTSGGFALEFDRPATFTKAELRLTATEIKFEGLAFSIFELRMPKFFEGGAPTYGIAAKYENDVGIKADPAYIDGEGDFGPDWPKKWAAPGDGSITANWTRTLDGPNGIPALTHKYVVNDLAPCTLSRRMSSRRSWLPSRTPKGDQIRLEIMPQDYLAKKHEGAYDELYFRYYLKLRAGYGCAQQGKKLPGLAGRYGILRILNAAGDCYYEPHSAGGGSKTYGDERALLGTQRGLSGWSMRKLAHVAPGDANPYRKKIRLGTYAYHVHQVGLFGDDWMWGNSSIGHVAVDEERWYCIEERVKVNTVIGPFGATGNGTGLDDGIYQIWLDGVLVYSDTRVCYRKNEAIRIDEIWLDHYHGGVTPAEAVHPWQMAALVIARAYIGPIRDTTSPPIDTTPPGVPLPFTVTQTWSAPMYTTMISGPVRTTTGEADATVDRDIATAVLLIDGVEKETQSVAYGSNFSFSLQSAPGALFVASVRFDDNASPPNKGPARAQSIAVPAGPDLVAPGAPAGVWNVVHTWIGTANADAPKV